MEKKIDAPASRTGFQSVGEVGVPDVAKSLRLTW